MAGAAGGETGLIIRRGQIFLVELDPVRGAEQGKVRPAVVVSNNSANDAAARLGRGVVTVVPITSNVDRVFPFQVLIDEASGLHAPSKAQAEQVRSVSVTRLVRSTGWVRAEQMGMLDAALALHLGL